MPFATAPLDAVPPRRHDHRVRTVSTDYALLRRLDHLVITDTTARAVVAAVCAETATPEPRLRFHARRSPFTGLTEAPRSVVAELAARRDPPLTVDLGQVPEHGAIRLGRRSTLMTIAHELGHHLVHHHDPVGTPDHGNRWVERFDQSAAIIAGLAGLDVEGSANRPDALRDRRHP